MRVDRLVLHTCLLVVWVFTCLSTAAQASTADHHKFKELQREFRSGPEVTQACLSCHTEAAKQVMKTKHWTLEYLNPETHQLLGKRHLVNNFCISIETNFAYCTSCHAGYGFKDNSFDFSKQENVDCLVCHDTTGKYSKPPGLAGNPPLEVIELPPGSGKFIKPVDLKNVAQNVGKSSRDTCGACHFYGGGGDGVKHGDLDSSMAAPDINLDVHMDATGLDFACATCHVTDGHQVPGSRYAPTAMDKSGARMRGKADTRNPTTCVACHGNEPHPVKTAQLNNHGSMLNDHTSKLACQVCHIPSLARGGVPTKVSWDWSTAGKLTPEGKPFVKKDEKGHVIYDSKKGDFTFGENVVPEYVWFNGRVKYTLLSDKLEIKNGVAQINSYEGSPNLALYLPLKVRIFNDFLIEKISSWSKG